MRWRHVRPSEGRTMPWRNGAGSTLELAVDPPGASLESGFGWRLSSADVAGSGPFSAFPGLVRWLVLLEGEGLDLHLEPDGPHSLLGPLEGLWFRGDQPVLANLRGGPVLDLNLMVDPRRWRARGHCLEVTRPVRLEVTAALTLLVGGGGTLWLHPLGLCLGRRHLVRLEGGHGILELAPGFGGARLVVAELDPVEGPG